MGNSKNPLEGNVLAVARLMRSIEDEAPEAVAAMEDVYHHTGRAFIVGLTGVPGAGKSSLIGTLIPNFRKKNMSVGVVAVDPTSPFTGGAILGDRIRMQNYGIDKEVFIRSLASRGWKGGLSKATVNIVHVMDAMGKDIIFVESVGAGQNEVDIARVADTTLVLLIPGMGDEIQMMKAGILEVADIFVVNKADREGADNVKTWLEVTLGMKNYPAGVWKPRVVMTDALSERGIDELADAILQHKDFLVASGELEKRRKTRARLELMMAVESYLNDYISTMDKGYLEGLVDKLAQREIHPRSAATEIIKPFKDS
ncbi:MAG: methylmalonyl Co-A mutase-associated GTPase MeaB [Chloroflexota bacterium]